MEKINTLSSPYLVKYITSYVRETWACDHYGGSLKDIIEKYKKKGEYIPEDKVLKLMKQTLSGVMVLHMHKNKIPHKDLKPGSILIDSNKNSKLSNFGISEQLLCYI